MVWSENIYVMIMTHEKFSGFTTKPIADTKTNIAGLFSLSVESVDEINNILTNGLKAITRWDKIHLYFFNLV